MALPFLFFHKRLCGPLANSRFDHQPDPPHRPNNKLEAAYYKADKAIENIVDLLGIRGISAGALLLSGLLLSHRSGGVLRFLDANVKQEYFNIWPRNIELQNGTGISIGRKDQRSGKRRGQRACGRRE